MSRRATPPDIAQQRNPPKTSQLGRVADPVGGVPAPRGSRRQEPRRRLLAQGGRTFRFQNLRRATGTIGAHYWATARKGFNQYTRKALPDGGEHEDCGARHVREGVGHEAGQHQIISNTQLSG